MGSTRNITLLFLLLLLGVSAFEDYTHYQAQSTRQAQLNSVLQGTDETPTLGVRTQSSGCLIRGALPDPSCSPGAVFPDASDRRFCTSGYTQTVRNVSAKVHKEVFEEYGISYPQPFGAYEVDHIIPLAIGGSNDIANLYPEAASPTPGFHEKDIVEVYLQEEVCAGRIALGIAQERIASNWLAIYENLSPADIARIKAKYRSWSN